MTPALRGEDTKDMDTALRTCLDHGRTEIVREALEVPLGGHKGLFVERTGSTQISIVVVLP